MNYEEQIQKNCVIPLLGNMPGIVTAIYITKKGVEYQVRYFLDGKAISDYFFDWEVVIDGQQ